MSFRAFYLIFFRTIYNVFISSRVILIFQNICNKAKYLDDLKIFRTTINEDIRGLWRHYKRINFPSFKTSYMEEKTKRTKKH